MILVLPIRCLSILFGYKNTSLYLAPLLRLELDGDFDRLVLRFQFLVQLYGVL